MIPLTHKYLPKNPTEVQGQDKAVAAIAEFTQRFPNVKKRAIIITGPPGCGKTSSVIAIGKQFDMELLEINASDSRNAAGIEDTVGQSCQQMSLFMKQKLILIDEIDGISGVRDRGGISVLTKLIDKTQYPIVMTANDPYNKKFSALRKKCEIIEFHTLSYLSVFAVLKRICDLENIVYEESALKARSEERRVGKECRSRWSPYH